MVAEVIIQSNVKNLDRIFDYNIPEELEDKVKIGSRVLVQFGNLKKLEDGFVIGIKENSNYKIKDISSVQKGSIEEEKINLSKWIAKRYFCNISDCLKLMLPPGTSTKNISNRVKERTQLYVTLNKTENEIEELMDKKVIKSDKQIKILRFLEQQNGAFVSEIETFLDVTKSIINTLEKNGFVVISERQIERDPFVFKKTLKTNKLKLTKEQQYAYDTINDAINEDYYSEFLIHGVTGSRKNRNISSIN